MKNYTRLGALQSFLSFFVLYVAASEPKSGKVATSRHNRTRRLRFNKNAFNEGEFKRRRHERPGPSAGTSLRGDPVACRAHCARFVLGANYSGPVCFDLATRECHPLTSLCPAATQPCLPRRQEEWGTAALQGGSAVASATTVDAASPSLWVDAALALRVSWGHPPGCSSEKGSRRHHQRPSPSSASASASSSYSVHGGAPTEQEPVRCAVWVGADQLVGDRLGSQMGRRLKAFRLALGRGCTYIHTTLCPSKGVAPEDIATWDRASGLGARCDVLTCFQGRREAAGQVGVAQLSAGVRRLMQAHNVTFAAAGVAPPPRPPNGTKTPGDARGGDGENARAWPPRLIGEPARSVHGAAAEESSGGKESGRAVQRTELPAAVALQGWFRRWHHSQRPPRQGRRELGMAPPWQSRRTDQRREPSSFTRAAAAPTAAAAALQPQPQPPPGVTAARTTPPPTTPPPPTLPPPPPTTTTTTPARALEALTAGAPFHAVQVAVHVRRGDLATAPLRVFGTTSWGRYVPDAWFLAQLGAVRAAVKRAGGEPRFHVFSEGDRPAHPPPAAGATSGTAWPLALKRAYERAAAGPVGDGDGGGGGGGGGPPLVWHLGGSMEEALFFMAEMDVLLFGQTGFPCLAASYSPGLHLVADPRAARCYLAGHSTAAAPPAPRCSCKALAPRHGGNFTRFLEHELASAGRRRAGLTAFVRAQMDLAKRSPPRLTAAGCWLLCEADDQGEGEGQSATPPPPEKAKASPSARRETQRLSGSISGRKLTSGSSEAGGGNGTGVFGSLGVVDLAACAPGPTRPLLSGEGGRPSAAAPVYDHATFACQVKELLDFKAAVRLPGESHWAPLWRAIRRHAALGYPK